MNQIHEEEKHQKAQTLTLLPSTATFAPALPEDNFSTTKLQPVIPKPETPTWANISWFSEFLQIIFSFYNHSAIHIISSMNTIYFYSNTFKPLQSKTQIEIIKPYLSSCNTVPFNLSTPLFIESTFILLLFFFFMLPASQRAHFATSLFSETTQT